MLIIVIINVNDLDLDSVIQCLYLINNLQESLINLFIYIYLLFMYKGISKFDEAAKNYGDNRCQGK